MSVRASSSRRPQASLYGRSFVTRTFAVMWVLGGAIVMLQLALSDEAARAQGPLWVISSAAVATGWAAWALRRRLPAAVFLPGTYLGVATITAAGVVAGPGSVSTALVLLYVWSAMFAFLFFPLRTAVAVAVAATASHAVAVSLTGSPSLASPLMLSATIAMVGLVVDGLHRARASEVDVLTGAVNRAGLDRFLEPRLRGMERRPAALAVAMLDVDEFTRVNAVDGHAAGDRLLAELAERWRSQLGDGDLLARVGGDRFAVVLRGRGSDEVSRVVDWMRSATPDPVTCSAGVAFWDVGDSAAMLVRRAEAALYRAKRAGRDRNVVDGHDGSLARELAAAIERDELVLMAQPTVDARTGRISGFETLVRWQHPDRGLLGPLEFIPLAESTGLIVPLGLWVLDQACRHARTWRQRFPDETLSVAVNISGRQLEHAGFVGEVAATLQRHEVPAELLTLELTESVLADDLGSWRQRLWELRELGVGLSMDDFGTGYSSLNQLRHLPFETIKIDRSFVSDLPDSLEASALVAAMVGMARGLGKRTVAEGVETVEQLVDLRRHGVDELQGYLLGRPAPIEQAQTLVGQQARTHLLVRAAAAAAPIPARRHDDLHRLAADLGPGSELEELVRPLLEHLAAAGGLASAYLTRIDWPTASQHILLSHNTGDLHITEGVAIAWADTLCRRALRDGIDRTDDARRQFPDGPAAHQLRIGAYATAPVVLSDGTLYGTLCAADSRPGPIGDELVSLLMLYSRLIAQLISPHRLAAPSGGPTPPLTAPAAVAVVPSETVCPRSPGSAEAATPRSSSTSY